MSAKWNWHWSNPPILDYSALTRRRLCLADFTATAGGLAAVLILVASITPPIAGSGRVGPNVFFDLFWGLAFVATDAYVWLRLAQERRGFRIARILTGAGATGALVALALMLLVWRPPWGFLRVACAVCVFIAAAGRGLGWFSGRAKRSSAQEESGGQPSRV